MKFYQKDEASQEGQPEDLMPEEDKDKGAKGGGK